MDLPINWPAAAGAFLGLFAMMNPIGNTGIFVGMVEGLPASLQRRAALKSCLAVWVILVGSIFGGVAILKGFGISMGAFQAAGGIIVLGIGLKMLHGTENRANASSTGASDSGVKSEAAEAAEEADVDSRLVVPLAMPILAGPGSITTVVMVATDHSGMDGRIGTAIGTTALVLCLLACFLASSWIARFLNERTQGIILRFMGLILVAIAVGMVFDGVATAFGLSPTLSG
ncbi:MAG: NAAT family transporter [Planctomycetota bacterium]|nr:NAAT family transporter [Planctomycetota bacterium]MDA1106715.1 NAAT family transporter [Planctomycetota bacterium]